MISKLAMKALKVIEAAWLHGPSYDLASQAAFALESAQLLQPPETAAETERLRAELAQRTQDLADVHADREKLRARVAELKAALVDHQQSAASSPPGTFRLVADVQADDHDDAVYAASRAEYGLEEHGYEASVWVDSGPSESADGITQRIAPVQALREDSPAAHLAGLLSGSQPDVTAVEVLGDHTIRLTVRPHDHTAWHWWLTRFRVDVATITARGSVTTATGEHQGVTVHILGEGVTALMLAGRDGEGE